MHFNSEIVNFFIRYYRENNDIWLKYSQHGKLRKITVIEIHSPLNIINIQVLHEINNKRALAFKEDFPNNEKWARCNYLNNTGVNIHCLVIDTLKDK